MNPVPTTMLNLHTGRITGEPVVLGERTVGQMQGVFADEAARLSMDPNTVVYRTYGISAPEDTDKLLYATTVLEPGKVGSEYFMTRGHFHIQENRGEFCLTLKGQGSLILMDRDRASHVVPMSEGSICNIDGAYAHRVVNTGDEPLVFLVTWLADCAHDYASIESEGFSVRLLESGQIPAALRKAELFESEEEIHDFIRKFEACEYSNEEWTHSAHVAVAAYFCNSMAPVDAVNAVRDRIEKLNASNGVKQTIDRGYHETLTRFWMAAVRRWLNVAQPKNLVEAINGATSAFRERNSALMFYSRDQIMSWEARIGWVAPDIRTFAELEEIAD